MLKMERCRENEHSLCKKEVCTVSKLPSSAAKQGKHGVDKKLGKITCKGKPRCVINGMALKNTSSFQNNVDSKISTKYYISEY